MSEIKYRVVLLNNGKFSFQRNHGDDNWHQSPIDFESKKEAINFIKETKEKKQQEKIKTIFEEIY